MQKFLDYSFDHIVVQFGKLQTNSSEKPNLLQIFANRFAHSLRSRRSIDIDSHAPAYAATCFCGWNAAAGFQPRACLPLIRLPLDVIKSAKVIAAGASHSRWS